MLFSFCAIYQFVSIFWKKKLPNGRKNTDILNTSFKILNKKLTLLQEINLLLETKIERSVYFQLFLSQKKKIYYR